MIDPHLNHKVPHWNSFTIGSEIWAENSSYCFVKRSETKAERGKIEYVFSDGLLEKVNPSTADTVQELIDALTAAVERLECAGIICPEFHRVVLRAKGIIK